MRDLISRQAAIDALLELIEARRSWISTEDARKEISGIDASMCAIHDLHSASTTGKKRKRNGRDAYGKLLVGKWHLEIEQAEIVDVGDIPCVIRAGVGGMDYRGSYFHHEMEFKGQTGKWLVYEVANTEEEQPIAWECSECGAVVDCKTKFCPECGQEKEV